MNLSNKEYVYVIVTETQVYGAWTDPYDAVTWIFDDEPPGDNLDVLLAKMLVSGCPRLVKMPVNPVGEPTSVSPVALSLGGIE